MYLSLAKYISIQNESSASILGPNPKIHLSSSQTLRSPKTNFSILFSRSSSTLASTCTLALHLTILMRLPSLPPSLSLSPANATDLNLHEQQQQQEKSEFLAIVSRTAEPDSRLATAAAPRNREVNKQANCRCCCVRMHACVSLSCSRSLTLYPFAAGAAASELVMARRIRKRRLWLASPRDVSFHRTCRCMYVCVCECASVCDVHGEIVKVLCCCCCRLCSPASQRILRVSEALSLGGLMVV